MKVIGLTIKDMAQVFKPLEMEISMLVNSEKVNIMVKVNIFLMMV